MCNGLWVLTYRLATVQEIYLLSLYIVGGRGFGPQPLCVPLDIQLGRRGRGETVTFFESSIPLYYVYLT